ncbi:putative cytochrome C1 heme lyase [Podospora australis]|uniref:Holocytochrome c-type synthase n=1 Tax=Podospora australis TaxID=1536484 RepID=A0AAN6WLJ1_9PEZI|nr:putative cytochrome C1 heme lyase [Podospora australis]
MNIAPKLLGTDVSLTCSNQNQNYPTTPLWTNRSRSATHKPRSMHTDLLDTVLAGKDVVPEASEGSGAGRAARGGNTAANKMKGSESAPGGEEKCPVDHKTRDLWLQQARAAQQAGQPAPPLPQPHPTSNIALPPSQPQSQQQPPQQSQAQQSSWTSWLRNPFSSSPSLPSQEQAAVATSKPRAVSPQNILGEERTISSIPRSSDPSGPPQARPSNHEQETGASESGHWIYPSEKQFFEAMKRKGFTSAQASDMKTVVPIHNAVNERAWAEILKWEAPYDSKSCGGPRLYSFAGEKGNMTPKARINTLLGYTAPFDRHDWIVDRCGTKVEYVIDFYSGRNTGNGEKLNFYLDVRPKLNSWEGIKMRALRATGLA